MVEEDDDVVVSSVGSEVAVQCRSGHTKSSTVRTLDLRCCCDSFCPVTLFTGSGKALASLLFKPRCSSSGQAALSGSFHCCRFELAGLMSRRFKFSFRESLNHFRRRSWLRLADTNSP